VTRLFEIAFIQIDIICDPADMRFVGIRHHSDSHNTIVQASSLACQDTYGRMKTFIENTWSN